MTLSFNNAGNILRQVVARLAVRRDAGPIETIDEVNRFASTRSAFVAQKKLYGYLRTRIGTRFPKVFADEEFAQSINIAKMHVFAASLSDLSIYVIARGMRDANLDEPALRRLAGACFANGLADNEGHGGADFSADQAIEEFQLRLNTTDWYEKAHRRENFFASPGALVRWAPIAPELKQFDREIVENSIIFAWNEVRAQYEKRVVAAKLAEDFNRQAATGH